MHNAAKLIYTQAALDEGEDDSSPLAGTWWPCRAASGITLSAKHGLSMGKAQPL